MRTSPNDGAVFIVLEVHNNARNLQFPLDDLAGGFNEAAVVKQVTNGKGAMPAFGGRLGDEDIANVAAYVIATSKAGWEL